MGNIIGDQCEQFVHGIFYRSMMVKTWQKHEGHPDDVGFAHIRSKCSQVGPWISSTMGKHQKFFGDMEQSLGYQDIRYLHLAHRKVRI